MSSLWLLAVVALSLLEHAPSTAQAELRWHKSFRLPMLHILCKDHQLRVPQGLLNFLYFLFRRVLTDERLIFGKDFKFFHVAFNDSVDVRLFLDEEIPDGVVLLDVLAPISVESCDLSLVVCFLFVLPVKLGCDGCSFYELNEVAEAREQSVLVGVQDLLEGFGHGGHS